jgi:hypothetical protein
VRSARVGLACCWVAVLACGGITQRQGNDDESGGTSAGGSNNANRSGSGSRAGNAGIAGSTSAAAGSSVMMPTPSGEPAPCFNDTDCPGSACGGQVCNWTLVHPNPVGEKAFVCNPAGSQQPIGKDGWCTTDDNCKCRGAGAKCVIPYCTFTR